VLAVDHSLSRALRVFAGGVLKAELLRARSEQDELREIAVEHRQIRDLPRLECDRHIGAVGLQYRGGSCDRDLFRELTGLQLNVRLGGSIHVDDHRFDHRSFETARLDFDPVCAGNQTRLVEIA
jgi:hypothetical protein